MHIVQILPALNEGGVERGTVELNREFVKLGHRSTVISAGGKLAGEIDSDGGEHITLDVRSKNPLTALCRANELKKVLAQLNPSVVHYRSRVPGWLFVMANKSLKLPFVSTVHGFNSVSFYSRVMTFGQRVICPGSGVVDYIKKHYKVPDEKIRLVYRGIDPHLFDHHRLDMNFIAQFEERYSLRDAFVVLGVGRVTRLKGYDVLIRAVAEAKKEMPDIKCIIAGSVNSSRAGYAESLRHLVEELEIEDHVVFAGGQKRIAEIYTCADVLISSNECKPEAFGRTMAEALAMDCPVIASRFGGALDIVREGEDGFLYTAGDYKELAEIMIKIRRTEFTSLREDALARFGLDQMVGKTLAVYEEVLSQCANA
ncbi:MAG: glycosyltransferase family 4 protein [Kiritimatiellia bacterium]